MDKNGEIWTGGMHTDRVVRLDPKTGKTVEYLLPTETNMRSVFVDNSTTPVDLLDRQQPRRRPGQGGAAGLAPCATRRAHPPHRIGAAGALFCALPIDPGVVNPLR